MAIITAPAAGRLRMDLFNFDRLTDFDSVIVTQTSSLLAIDVDGYRYAFSGTGVRYNSFGEPISGAITGFRFTQGSTVLFEANGFSVDASLFYLLTYAPNDPLTLLLAGNDDYRGGALADVVRDVFGHNVIMGGGDSDVLTGGNGNDHIYGQSPSGGPDGGDLLNGGGGSDYLQGNAGRDTIDGGSGSDRIQGGADDDSILGGAGHDVINGNRGRDSIQGGSGNDALRGGQDDDTIQGGEGDDLIMGDRGIDRLEGGSGRDVFLFGPDSAPVGPDIQAIDRILDLSTVDDVLSLGFRPEAILEGSVSTSLAEAQALAQSLLDQRAGNHEVALIRLSGANDAVLFWSQDGGATVNAAVALGASFVTGSLAFDDFI